MGESEKQKENSVAGVGEQTSEREEMRSNRKTQTRSRKASVSLRKMLAFPPREQREAMLCSPRNSSAGGHGD